MIKTCNFFFFTLKLIEAGKVWSMAGPQKAAEALIAMNTGYFLCKLLKSKHKPVNKFLAKLNHHLLSLLGIFYEM